MSHELNEYLLPNNFLQASALSTLQENLDELEKFLKTLPVKDYHLDVSWNQSYEVNTRLCEIESVEFQDDVSLTCVLFAKHKSTQIQCHGTDLQSWIKSVKAATDYLSYIDSDPCSGLEDSYDYQKQLPDVYKFFPKNLTSEQWHQYVLSMEQAALGKPKVLNSEGAYGQICYSVNLHRNSRGLNLCLPSSYYSAGLSVVAQDEEKSSQQVDGSYTGGLKWNQLDDPETVGQQAALKACEKLQPRTLPSAEYPIIFTSDISGHLIKALLRALSGTAQYKKASFLNESLNKQVLPKWCTLQHEPLSKEGYYSYPICQDAMAAQPLTLIDSGVVCEYILSLYSARRLKMTPNRLAGGARNVSMTTNALNLEEIMSKFDRAILVDEVLGTGMNIVNGDYSMGINGFLVEKGQKTYPLKNTTIASTLDQMLNNIVYHAKDYKKYKNLHIGALAIASMNVSSQG